MNLCTFYFSRLFFLQLPASMHLLCSKCRKCKRKSALQALTSRRQTKFKIDKGCGGVAHDWIILQQSWGYDDGNNRAPGWLQLQLISFFFWLAKYTDRKRPTGLIATMFEGAIAAFLNRLLGRYVEDLDTEQFNVGIFSGDTCLTDLKLKPEALVRLFQ